MLLSVLSSVDPQVFMDIHGPTNLENSVGGLNAILELGRLNVARDQ